MSNIVCAMSGFSMGSGPAIFIPLVRPRLRKGIPIDLSGLSRVVSATGSCELFMPLTLPIRGEVDGYGSLQGIVPDANTRAIERVFGLPIQDFVTQTTRGRFFAPAFRPALRQSFAEPVGGCFVQGQIYERFSTSYTHPWGADGWSLWHSGTISEVALRMMGCAHKHEDVWVHPMYPHVRIRLDETNCVLEWQGGSEEPIHPAALAGMLENHGGGPAFPDEIRQRMLRISADAIRIDAEVQHLKKQRAEYVEKDKPRNFYMKVCGSFLLSLLDPAFPDRFWPELEGGLLHPHIEGLYTFLRNMHACNRMLMPSFCGPAEGHHPAHEQLLQATLELVRERLAKERPRVEA